MAAEKRLAQRGIDVFLPKRSVLKTWSDRKKKVIEPLFRSYIFAKVNELVRLDVLRDDAILTTIRDATINRFDTNKAYGGGGYGYGYGYGYGNGEDASIYADRELQEIAQATRRT